MVSGPCVGAELEFTICTLSLQVSYRNLSNDMITYY